MNTEVYSLLNNKDIIYSCRIFIQRLPIVKTLAETNRKIEKIKRLITIRIKDKDKYIKKAIYRSIQWMFQLQYFIIDLSTIESRLKIDFEKRG